MKRVYPDLKNDDKFVILVIKTNFCRTYHQMFGVCLQKQRVRTKDKVIASKDLISIRPTQKWLIYLEKIAQKKCSPTLYNVTLWQRRALKIQRTYKEDGLSWGKETLSRNKKKLFQKKNMISGKVNPNLEETNFFSHAAHQLS